MTCGLLTWYDTCCSAPKSARQRIELVLEKRMHSVVCIKQVLDPVQSRARFRSNTIVQRGVPTNCHEPVTAEIVVSSVTRRPARPTCSLRSRIHLSPDCGRVRTLGAEAAMLSTECSSVDDAKLPTTYARTIAISNIRALSGGTAVVFFGKSAIDGNIDQVGAWIAKYVCVCCSSITSPQPSASISASAASDAEPRGYGARRKRPRVRRRANGEGHSSLIKAMFNRQSKAEPD